MTDGDNKCPLCGKNTDGEEIFCRDCQEIAQNTFSTELIDNEPLTKESDEKEPDIENTDTISEENTESEVVENPTRRSNKGWYIFVGICIFIMLSVGIGSYFFIENRNEEETEIAYWRQCVIENSPLGYSKYLVQYPEGKFSEEAHNKIAELRNKERNEWEELRNSNDVDALFAFLTDHPETPYTREIRHAIDSLSWAKTIEDNTADAYLAYLENVKIERYPGEYQSQAQERYDYLSQLKTVEGAALDSLKTVVSDFFESLSEANEKNLRKNIASALSQFFKAENQSAKMIVDSIKVNFKNNKIKEIVYSPVTDSIEAIQDNKGIYLITLPLHIEKSYTDRKLKKEISRDTMNVVLNSKKLVQSVYKK